MTTAHRTLRLGGSLDAGTAGKYREVIRSLVAERPSRLTVDLTSLESIDGSGVGALVSLYKQMRAQGTEVQAVGAAGQPLEIFKLMNLAHFLRLRARQEQAYVTAPAQMEQQIA